MNMTTKQPPAITPLEALYNHGLMRVIQRGWGCDVRHNATEACFVGDCDFGMIRFRQALPRSEVEAAARLIDQAPRMLLELQLHWIEGECYCLSRSEGGRAVGVCAHCSTGQLLKSLGWDGDVTALRMALQKSVSA